MRNLSIVPLLALSIAPAQSVEPEPRMNQIQILGSHNSYKQAIDPSLRTLLAESIGQKAEALDYSHVTLSEQLDLGIRSLEIDVVHDPQGGRYAAPRGVALVHERGKPAGPPYDPEKRMLRPGLKVLHIPDIDFRTTVYTLEQALRELRSWSEKHPAHAPIIVTMNAKDEGVNQPGYTRPLPFDAAAFDAWDAELRTTLGAVKLITPDQVRGKHKTLEQAVLAHDWPTLAQARGRFLFVLDETGAKRQAYIAGHPSLKGRAMFVNAEENTPEAAFRIVNDPVEDLSYIQHLVRSGYIVRTRADADTIEARKGDYSRWKAALASGAHVITTDYYKADPNFRTGYSVQLPGRTAARWNPLLLPATRPLSQIEP